MISHGDKNKNQKHTLRSIVLIIISLSFISIGIIFNQNFFILIISSVIAISTPTIYVITSKTKKEGNYEREELSEELLKENIFSEEEKEALKEIVHKIAIKKEKEKLVDKFIEQEALIQISHESLEKSKKFLDNSNILEKIMASLGDVGIITLEDLEINTLSTEFWKKLSLLEMTDDDKPIFIQEMLGFNPKDRMSFVNMMLTNQNLYKKKRGIS